MSALNNVMSNADVEYENWCAEYAEAHYAAEEAAQSQVVALDAGVFWAECRATVQGLVDEYVDLCIGDPGCVYEAYWTPEGAAADLARFHALKRILVNVDLPC